MSVPGNGTPWELRPGGFTSRARSPKIHVWGEERPAQNPGHDIMTIDTFIRSLLSDDASLSFADLVIEVSCHFDLDKEDAVAALTAWIDGTSDAVLAQDDVDDQGEVSLATDDDDDPDGTYWETCIEAERAGEAYRFGDWT